MEQIIQILLSRIEVFGVTVPLLWLIAGFLIVWGVARRVWSPVGVVALVAIFSYWIPFLKN